MSVLLAFYFGLVGALMASFVGVIAERAYTGQSWKRGHSRCNSCRRQLTARDLVPVLSWVRYRGRCRACGARVPWQYPLSELILGGLFALSYIHFGLGVPLLLFLLALLTLSFIVLYDLRHTIVPPPSSSLLILLSLLFAAMTTESMHAFIITILTALGIGLAFFLLYFLSGGRAMGLGDTPVAIGLSLLAGAAAISGVLFSFWVGAVIGVLVLFLRKGGPRMGIEVPFVPFMAIGFLLAIFTQWNPLPF